MSPSPWWSWQLPDHVTYCHNNVIMLHHLSWGECTLVCPGAGLWPWAAHCQIMTNVTMIQHTISHFLESQEGSCLIHSFADGQSTNSIFLSPEKEVRMENMTETWMDERGDTMQECWGPDTDNRNWLACSPITKSCTWSDGRPGRESHREPPSNPF